MSNDAAVHSRPAQLMKAANALVPGNLVVSRSHLRWNPADATAAGTAFATTLQLITGLQKAKGQPVLRVVTASSSKIFKLDSVAERDEFVDVMTPLKDAACAAAGATSSAQLPSAAVQKDIFDKHPDIKDLHNRLVVPGVISKAEFWQSKQALVRAAESKGVTQRKGMSTALLTLISGGINSANATINISITPEVTNQIFAESPAVKIAFQSTVPHVKTKEAFWDEYFRYIQRKLERRRKRAAGTITATDELLSEFEETLHRYEQDAEAKRQAERRSLLQVDPTVNVAADFDDGFTVGYGTAHRPGLEDAATGRFGSRADDIMRELNQHAAVVLPGRQGAPGSSASMTGGTSDKDATLEARMARNSGALDDLKIAEAPESIELTINDPNKYFKRSSDEDADVPSRSRAAVDPAVLNAGGQASSVDAKLAFTALEEMMAGASQDGELDEEFGLPRNPATGLIPQMLEGIRKQALTGNELLRHFWRGFPINSDARANKMQRIVKAIHDLYSQSEAMQTAARGMDRVHIRQLLKCLLQCMDVAFTRMDDENRLKKARVS